MKFPAMDDEFVHSPDSAGYDMGDGPSARARIFTGSLESNIAIVIFLFPLEIEQVGTAAFRLPCSVSLLRSD